MKVTVSFGNVRIVVPNVGSKSICLVSDLIREATRRYKKATGKVTSTLLPIFIIIFINDINR